MQELGSLKSFLSDASQLSWASTLVSSRPELPGAHRREWLQADGWETAGILLLPECPLGSGTHSEGLGLL